MSVDSGNVAHVVASVTVDIAGLVEFQIQNILPLAQCQAVASGHTTGLGDGQGGITGDNVIYLIGVVVIRDVVCKAVTGGRTHIFDGFYITAISAGSGLGTVGGAGSIIVGNIVRVSMTEGTAGIGDSLDDAATLAPYGFCTVGGTGGIVMEDVI